MRNEDRCLLEMDVIKAIDKHTREDGTLDDDISCILEEVESVDAKYTNVPSKWIPCIERLPEKNKLVLGWYKDNPFSGYTYGIVMKTKMGWVFDYGNRYCSNVAAWMPLSEPYKVENHEGCSLMQAAKKTRCEKPKEV